MAIISAGYAGTVNDLQWAQMARYFGMDYAVKTAADIACTQNGANKNFNIAAGEFWGHGVMDVNNAIVNVAPVVPAAGQWFLIVARRTWATKATTFVAVASSTTTTDVPATAPAAFPAINANPGVTDDQPLYWVWLNSANTTTKVIDLRKLAALRFQMFKPANEATRLAILTATNGDMAEQLDTGVTYKRVAGAWVPVLSGVRTKYLSIAVGTTASGTALGTMAIPRREHTQRVVLDLSGYIAPVGAAGNVGVVVAASAGGTTVTNPTITSSVPNGLLGGYARKSIFDIAPGVGDVILTLTLSVSATATSAQAGLVVTTEIYPEGQF